MEPLSFTASILAVIAKAQAGVQGLRKLNAFRKAPQELEDLALELERTNTLLQDIEGFLEMNPLLLYNGRLSQSVQCAASKIHEISKLLSSERLKQLKFSNAAQARLIYIRYKDRLRALRDDLRMLRMDLAVRLGMVTAVSSCRIEESLGVSVSKQHQASHELSVAINGSQPCEREARSVRAVLTEDAKQIAIRDCGEAESLLGGPCNEVQIEKLVQPKLIHDSPRCPSWCSCACHKSGSFRSPWLFRTVFGEISLQYNTQQARCNEKSCRRLDNSSLSLVYQLPRYLTCRYIAMRMRYAPLDGPHFSLRIPRITMWTHLLWNYAMVGNLTAIQKMFSEGRASPYDVNLHGSNALIYAISHNRAETSRFLLEQGADPELPNEAGRTAVDIYWENSFAGKFGQDGARYHGSIFAESDYVLTRQLTTLHKIVLGIIYKDLKCELELSTADIDVRDGEGRTPLCWATIRDDQWAVNTLLAFGADPNIRDSHGFTPLHFVRGTSVCKLLLDAKIDINVRNSYYSRTALHTHNHERDVDVIDMLVEAGIDINAQDADGETPLLIVIYNLLTPLAQRLLELGADVNATNWSRGYSALHFATEFNGHELLPELLERGADYTRRTTSGKTILHLAARYSGTETLSVLMNANLQNLDMASQDLDGKSAADYLSERCILVEIKREMREKFHDLLQYESCRNKNGINLKTCPRPIRKVCIVTETSPNVVENHHIPGAFPVIDEI